MAKVKKFYSNKSNEWTSLGQVKTYDVVLSKDINYIEVVMQLVTLFGLIFKTKVPALIFVNQIKYGLSIKYLESNQVIVGYSDDNGQFFIQFENSTEKKAKKDLAEFLKSKGIV
jgi:hypothetical protein